MSGKVILKPQKLKRNYVSNFFNAVAIDANISEIETVKKVYYGMLKTLGKTLKSEETVEFPDLGTFFLTEIDMPRLVKGDGKVKVLRFSADSKLKNFIKKSR